MSAIADAKRTGQLRARRALSTDVLRHVTRAAKRKREADSEYEQAVTRAGRLGLSHREIATAAQVSHGTVRAILARATASPNGNAAQAAAREPARRNWRGISSVTPREPTRGRCFPVREKSQ